jgi:hypothetical protein
MDPDEFLFKEDDLDLFINLMEKEEVLSEKTI